MTDLTKKFMDAGRNEIFKHVELLRRRKFEYENLIEETESDIVDLLFLLSEISRKEQEVNTTAKVNAL
jgi:hypothetical protein